MEVIGNAPDNMYSKSQRLLIIFIVLVSVMVFVSLIFFGFKKPSQNPPHSPLPITYQSSQPQPTTNPPIKYDSQKSVQLLQKVKQRAPLSASDLEIKNQLITALNKKEGVVNQTSNYKITYVPPDDFLVEILTTDVSKVKTEVVNWFTEAGLSQKAVCDIPVVFYLNRGVSEQLRDQHIEFNPLAEGC